MEGTFFMVALDLAPEVGVGWLDVDLGVAAAEGVGWLEAGFGGAPV